MNLPNATSIVKHRLTAVFSSCVLKFVDSPFRRHAHTAPGPATLQSLQTPPIVPAAAEPASQHHLYARWRKAARRGAGGNGVGGGRGGGRALCLCGGGRGGAMVCEGSRVYFWPAGLAGHFFCISFFVIICTFVVGTSRPGSLVDGVGRVREDPRSFARLRPRRVSGYKDTPARPRLCI